MTTITEQTKPASIVIPNYNGRNLLKDNLPYLNVAAKRYAGRTELIVVDDASTYNSIEYLERHFPDIRTIKIDANVGFAEACEAGIRAARYDIVIMLNTDVRVTEDFIVPLMAHFSDESVFAVSAMSFGDGRNIPRELAKVPFFKRGHLKFVSAQNPDLIHAVTEQDSSPIYTFYAVGAHCAIDKQKYFSLGDFDNLYYPFYWKDVDLCYRAWKHGWKSTFEPKSNVYHTLSGPIHSENHLSYKANIIKRNRLLFLWKNITSIKYLYLSHLLPVLIRSCFGMLVLDFNFYRVLFSALLRLPQARRCRKLERRRGQQLSDERIFELSSALLSSHATSKERTPPLVLRQ